jgi:hypothetical protein
LRPDPRPHPEQGIALSSELSERLFQLNCDPEIMIGGVADHQRDAPFSGGAGRANASRNAGVAISKMSRSMRRAKK